LGLQPKKADAVAIVSDSLIAGQSKNREVAGI